MYHLQKQGEHNGKESYDFKNYYNHTAATYKGIRGQLFSSVQLIESYEKNGKEWSR